MIWMSFTFFLDGYTELLDCIQHASPPFSLVVVHLFMQSTVLRFVLGVAPNALLFRLEISILGARHVEMLLQLLLLIFRILHAHVSHAEAPGRLFEFELEVDTHLP